MYDPAQARIEAESVKAVQEKGGSCGISSIWQRPTAVGRGIIAERRTGWRGTGRGPDPRALL
ncbi:hypothetical protein ACQPZA_31235 [Pseudonocardia xinjiangensis]|uniref:hypothetical protein n=1 Tax=Pseudonocardia xinjiangensis TaxID=75289 RepID=UPI003D8FB97E